jgi:predicted phosphoribosyltransferase
MFEDRTDAGERLADHLQQEGVTADIVLAIPRGGLPLGRAVADRLGVPLDIVVARKIGAPHNPEYAIGAVGADGEAWLDERTITRLNVQQGYLDEQIEIEADSAAEKERTYRDEPANLAGNDVLIVDDGIATGATMKACIRQAREEGARSVTVAVPVGPPSSIEDLREEADAVHCLETPASFRAVGQFYRHFDQVTDEEAKEYLSKASEKKG